MMGKALATKCRSRNHLLLLSFSTYFMKNITILILFLIFSTKIRITYQQNPNQCQNDNCQNGGTCLVASDLPVTSTCQKGTIYYMGFCYFFDPTLRNWNDAALYCNNMDSSTLPSIENTDDQAFFAGYLQGIIPHIDPSSFPPNTVRPDGIWTSIRGVNNITRPSWVQYPGSYLVTDYFWAQQEPNVYLDYNEVCVALESRTYYREWTTALCDVQKYTVCKIAPKRIESRYVGQCVCPSGFGGLNCELQNVPTQEATQKTCFRRDFQFSCQQGQSIVVEYASFGAKENSTCDQGSNRNALMSNAQTCSNVNSLQTVINACQGLQSCEIRNLTSIFSNTPCPVPEELYLETRLRCQNAESPQCGSSDQILYEGRCYNLEIETNEKKQLSFSNAESFCANKGGQLVTQLPDNLLQQIASKTRSETKKTMSFWMKSDDPNNCIQLTITSSSANYNTVPCNNDNSLANALCTTVPQNMLSSMNNRPAESVPKSVTEQQERTRQVYTGAQP